MTATGDGEIQQALRWGSECLAAAGIAEAVRESLLLLRLAMGQAGGEAEAEPAPLTDVYLGRGKVDQVLPRFRELVARRSRREPYAYLEGFREFMGLRLKVGHEVLVPRPETECLVAAVLRRLDGGTAYRILDVGTGSGAVALALAAHGSPRWHISATDISPAALRLARQNASRLNLSIAGWYVADLLPETGCFDVLVANLPYVDPEAPEAERDPELRFEPAHALYAEDGGLALIRRLVWSAQERWPGRGHLFLEVGQGQAPRVASMLEELGAHVAGPIQDTAGIWRVVAAEFAPAREEGAKPEEGARA